VDPPGIERVLEMWSATVLLAGPNRASDTDQPGLSPSFAMFGEERPPRTMFYWKPLLRGVTGFASPGKEEQ
jgi:hypothetical protein